MTVLVTGASGFLGQATAAAVRDAGHEVRTFQRRPSGVAGVQDVAGSMTDAAAVARAVDGVHAVVHLAAKVSLAGDPADFVRVNVEGTRTLVDAARRAGARRFVFVSSPSVAHTGSSLVGAGAGVAEPQHARGDYARTKAAAELLALDADAPGFAVVAVRPHLVWGPGDTQLIGRIVERARAGRLPLLDSGAALIDTLYVDNAASAMVAALEHAADDGVHGNAYVVTNGEPRPVADLLAGICAASGVAAPRWHVPAAVARAAGSLVEAVWRVRPGQDEPPMTRFLAEQLSTAHWFDQRRTRADLQWAPSVSIDEGLARLAAAQTSSAAT
ncbi:NAD-dependent epimerase/dehydratase family protein [Curtobacterium flaccumfaciens pv. oortii]|uniref:NAD-dependent epimerase/dehydratase family protein n=1 Tax=Curtobacterium flaccumfaciens TaxID=2035 RepID=UPI001BDF1172|nr:NAD-dependent epimerase/dehydratase family protein [Curtobacterium flaccumfaciens]MBT1624517.1 NAD-dependent epimerase/dehydratase family protein [Curtobacterium flaccumfaciens pv. oortii]